ncbi:MAG: trypsin-like peptidase domain-containing protein [Chloroflexi bacterium]|nr:trypsin-like peptidase domain-containing protein [Chloroflexota bacterium]
MLATLVALALYNLLLPAPRPLTISEMNEVVAQALASATPPPTFSARVYRVIQPSLVLIETQGSGLDDGEGRLGSGVVIDDLGDILTSLHVVAKASAIRITFADGTQSGAQVIVEQPENDIAVLRANRLPALLVPAILGNPDASRVGDEAFVVGNPFGLYSSMSAGVISGFGRSFEQPDNGQILQGLIQVDAAVNPGNSGGPLLNRDGHVIGIITGIVNPTEQDVFIGIGFAVPIGEAAAAAGSPPH